ncbi:MAG: (2Fe-2S) ferredoxin domain-containing protein [Christensenellales bacterium]
MVIVEVCVGSSCHIKGAPEIVSLLQQKVQENGLDGEVVLTGSFCTGRCNRVGVTVSVNDDVTTALRATISTSSGTTRL